VHSLHAPLQVSVTLCHGSASCGISNRVLLCGNQTRREGEEADCSEDAGLLQQPHLSRIGCSFLRSLCTTRSTSSTDSKLGPRVSSDMLKYHRGWGPLRTSGLCRSGGKDLRLPHLFCFPVTTFYDSSFFSLISYLYMLENLLHFF
jgi:hypothetical protein